MCEGASKQSPDFKNYTAPGQRPRFFLIPGSATEPYLFCCRHIRSFDEVQKTKKLYICTFLFNKNIVGCTHAGELYYLLFGVMRGLNL